MMPTHNRRLTPRILTYLLASLCAPVVANTLDTEPQTRSSPVISVPDAVKLDRFSGSSGYQYAIDVPPGTGGLTPRLALSYSSLSRGSEYGWGWSLNLSRIERSTRLGPPSYVDGQDQFELDGDLLVRDPNSPNRFHKQRTDFTRIEFFPGNGSTSSYWQVTQTDGTRYLYGSRPTAFSRLSKGAGLGGSAFRWNLDKVVDARDNSYTIDYECEPGGDATCSGNINYVYPRRIRYSFRPGETAPSTPRTQRLITFEWGARGNAGEDADRPTSFRSGFKVQIGRRLLRIRVGLDSNPDGVVGPGEQIRRYELSYAAKTSAATPGNAPFSELTAIQRFGPDDTTPFPTLQNPRPTRFTYSLPGRGFQPATYTMTKPPSQLKGSALRFSFNSQDTTAGLWDMDGDGILDRVVTTPNSGTRTWLVSLGLSATNGGPGFGPPFTWQWCTDQSPSSCQNEVPTDEPDRLTNLIQDTPETGVVALRVNADLIDLDGDGRADRVRSHNSASWTFRKNLGGRFGPSQTWAPPNLTTGDTKQTDLEARNINAIFQLGTASDRILKGKSRLVDVNGDGRPDHVAVDNIHAGKMWVSLNNGCTASGSCGFASPFEVVGDLENHNTVSYAEVVTQSDSDVSTHTYDEIADVNGDGLPDLISARLVSSQVCIETGFGNGHDFMPWQGNSSTGYSGGERDCRSATGASSWVTDHVGKEFTPVSFGIPVPETDGTLVDVNGDGVLDRIEVTSTIDGTPPYQVSIVFGLGDGKFTSQTIPWGPNNSTALRRQENITRDVIDIDGDGLVDQVFATISCDTCTNYDWQAQFNPGPEGLLIGVETELGEKETIEYKPSSYFAGKVATVAEPGEPTLVSAPHGTWVVSSVTLDDGRSGSAKQVTTFAYAEPRFDYAGREQRGFRMVESTDSAATLTRSLYHQTTEERSLLEAETVIAGGVTLLSHSIGWEAVPAENEGGVAIPGAVFAEPTLDTTSLFAGSSQQDHVRARQFDARYGVLLQERDYGADGLANTPDDLLTTRSYDPVDTAKWFLQHPRSQRQSFTDSGSGTVLLNDETLEYQTGLLSKRTVLRHNPVDGSTASLEEDWDHDGYGNATGYWPPSRPHASNAQVTTVWDPDYSTFPSSLTRFDGGSVSLVTTYAFDARFGEVTKRRNPRGYLECWGYDAFGRLSGKSDATASVGDLSATCDTTRAIYSFSDDKFGLPDSQLLTTLTSTFPGVSLEQRQYLDGLGRIYRTANQASTSPKDFTVTARSYGSRGELTCESEPARVLDGDVGTVTCGSSAAPSSVTQYDALLRPTQISLRMPSGGSTTDRLQQTVGYAIAEHDGRAGNELVETYTIASSPDPDVVREIAKDLNGSVVSLREVGGAKTYVQRDPMERIVLVDGPDVNIPFVGVDWNLMSIVYDSEGHRVRVGNPMSIPDYNHNRFTTYSYDVDGNLASISPARGANYGVTYSYDGLDRLRFKDFAPANTLTSPGPLDVVYTWDASAALGAMPGELATIATNSVTTDLLKELRGNLKQRRRTIGSTASTFNYYYDLSGRLVGTAYPDGLKGVARKYDGSLLTTINYPVSTTQLLNYSRSGTLTGVAAVIDSISHHSSGALQSMHYVNGDVTTTYGYSPQDYRLSHTSTSRSGTGLLQDLAYGYDTAGNLTSSSDSASGGQLEQGFAYDSSQRLLLAIASGSHAYPSQVYGYDAAGNLTGKGNLTLGYGDSNGGAHAVTGAHDPSTGFTVSYTYDPDGNLATRGWTIPQPNNTTMNALEWFGADAENRMSSYLYFDPVGGSGTATYTYDDQGTRVGRTATKTGLAAENTTTIDPEYELDNARAKVMKHVSIGGQRVLTIVTSTPGGQHELHYHPDQIGTSRLITDETGAVVQRSFADPFGAIYAVVDGADAPIAPSNRPSQYIFSSHHADVETNFHYFGGRYYDPLIGHFLSFDSELAGPSPGLTFDRLIAVPGILDHYRYASNDPINKVDPTGWAQVDLRYNLIPDVAVGISVEHAYIVVTDINGSQTIFRAGPQPGTPGLGPLGVLTSGVGGASGHASGSDLDSANSSSPGSGRAQGGAGPSGRLYAESDDYNKRRYDWPTDERPLMGSTTLISDNLPARWYTDQLANYESNVNQADIPYNPLSTNSNAYAYGAAQYLGATVTTPEDVRVPGSGTDLGVDSTLNPIFFGDYESPPAGTFDD
jgi:RHS repeat-associated protein